MSAAGSENKTRKNGTAKKSGAAAKKSGAAAKKSGTAKKSGAAKKKGTAKKSEKDKRAIVFATVHGTINYTMEEDGATIILPKLKIPRGMEVYKIDATKIGVCNWTDGEDIDFTYKKIGKKFKDIFDEEWRSQNTTSEDGAQYYPNGVKYLAGHFLSGDVTIRSAIGKPLEDNREINFSQETKKSKSFALYRQQNVSHTYTYKIPTYDKDYTFCLEEGCGRVGNMDNHLFYIDHDHKDGNNKKSLYKRIDISKRIKKDESSVLSLGEILRYLKKKNYNQVMVVDFACNELVLNNPHPNHGAAELSNSNSESGSNNSAGSNDSTGSNDDSISDKLLRSIRALRG